MKRFWVLVALLVASMGLHATQVVVSFPANMVKEVPVKGRLFLFFAQKSKPEPRFRVGWAGPDPMPFFAVDIALLNRQQKFVVPDTLLGYPLARLHQLPEGEYHLQVLLDVDTMYSFINAPGNWYSTSRKVRWQPGKDDTLYVSLTHRIPPEQLPPNQRFIQYIQINSERLSRFWNRPVTLKAGIILPRTYYENPRKVFPVVYRIGGFHTRYTAVKQLMDRDSDFYRAWNSPDAPQMIVVQLDGEAPFGDSYQMNSANNGPYMDALLQELIPAIETRYQAVAEPRGRFLTGESTGGWVSLALQIWNPDFFNGAWSFCPDAVDFHYLQLVDIYQDANAFVNEFGYERPSMRETDGEPVFSIRQEITMENVMGRTNRFVTSGGQWGSWNAVFGPRGPDGLPQPIWDPWSGKINPEVAQHWQQYDLLAYLKNHWAEVGPLLQGKIHIWMGDMDSFYLDNALRNLQRFFQQTTHPRSDARIYFQPDAGHCWHGITWLERLQQMQQRFAKNR